MATKFRVGVSVRAYAGGPPMTVKEHDEQCQAVCSWYAPHAGWVRQAFEEKQLKKSYEPRKPASRKRPARMR